MAKGKAYGIERIRRMDPETGVPYLQLTSFPTISMPLPYVYMSLTNSFTSDSRTIVFSSQRSNHRDAPFDLFRVDVDGANLVQLTERDDIRNILVAGTRRAAFFFEGGGLWSVDLDTFVEEEIAHLDLTIQGWSCLSADDRWCYVRGADQEGGEVLVRIATDGSGVETLHLEIPFRLYSTDPRGKGFYAYDETGDRRILLLVSLDGKVLSRYGCADSFAHCCPLGKSGVFQACAHLPQRAVLTLEEEQGEPQVLVEGPYFWHSSGSLDGKWIVADTNWPNVGLQLVCVGTRRFRTLLHPGNSAGHPQATHAHPQFSPDGRFVLFNSDRTGIAQIYVAEIPDEFRARLEAQ